MVIVLLFLFWPFTSPPHVVHCLECSICSEGKTGDESFKLINLETLTYEDVAMVDVAMLSVILLIEIKQSVKCSVHSIVALASFFEQDA